MKILCYLFVAYLAIGIIGAIVGGIYCLITSLKDNSKKGYNYVNPFDCYE